MLGRGRHGTVVRAVIDRFDGTEYACKRMPKLAPDAAGTPAERRQANAEQLENIKREIGLFTKLRSSLNVAKLEQVHEDKTHVYLVMEMCRGPSLDQVAADGPASVRCLCTFALRVSRGPSLDQVAADRLCCQPPVLPTACAANRLLLCLASPSQSRFAWGTAGPFVAPRSLLPSPL